MFCYFNKSLSKYDVFQISIQNFINYIQDTIYKNNFNVDKTLFLINEINKSRDVFLKNAVSRYIVKEKNSKKNLKE